MAHAVLTTSVGSIYDDLPEIRYHFPAAYLNQIKGAEGDWIIYYEPRRSRGGGRLAYFAMARIVKVVPDLDRQDHYYAYMDGYLAFDHAVGFRENNHYFETILQREDGNTSKGAFGRSVRDLPEEEFKAIVRAGFTRELEPWEEMDAATGDEQEAMLPPCPERPLIEGYVARPFRDQAFRRQVRQAYGNTCAFSGLKLLNGGGRPEVQAAHIQPVAFQGPDSVRNGLALTGTLHWLFDRGLVAVSEDYRLMCSPHGVPDDLARILRLDRRILMPEAPDQRPHPGFLDWHREHVFKSR